jgi:hypothetical protein
MSTVLNAINEVVTLTQINCGECGATYAINERYRQQKLDKGGGWHCPYCQCSWGYFGDTEAQKLKKQLEAQVRQTEFARNNAKAEREAREHTQRQLRAVKGVKTRMANRIKNGVCPCCHRSFGNLRQHMQTQHPAFSPATE